jgi:hypothetical protein
LDIEKIFKLARHHKRTFLALIVAIYAIFLVIAHFFFNQPLIDIGLDQIKSISSALITAIFTFFLILSFIPSEDKGEIEEIPAQKITSEFDKLLANAGRWRYKGNFGRYLRGRVLPALAHKQNVHITTCLIDPRDGELCKKHAVYRGSINGIDKGTQYDADTVAIEVLITIVIAAWYAANTGMQIDIYLSKAFDPIRIDSNDHAMILTVEDRRSPALKITKDHFTAKHFELQMKTARDQADPLDLGGMRHGIQLAEMNEADVISVLTQADMVALCKRLKPGAILEGCKKSRNPYEN